MLPSTAENGADNDEPAAAPNGAPILTSELARKYARLATRLVESVGEEVRGVEDEVSGLLRLSGGSALTG